MPRENSFSDSEGRSLTPDLSEDEGVAAVSPTYSHTPETPFVNGRSDIPSVIISPAVKSPTMGASLHSRTTQRQGSHIDRFRASVRKVMALRRSTNFLTDRGAGAEPGIGECLL